MSQDADSIVVDTDKTAQECISYLKAQKIGAFTFLPLNNLQAKPLDERLRHLG